MLNISNIILGIYEMSIERITGPIVDVRIILGVALKCGILCIIMTQNHPSGKLIPSYTDITTKKKMKNTIT